MVLKLMLFPLVLQANFSERPAKVDVFPMFARLRILKLFSEEPGAG